MQDISEIRPAKHLAESLEHETLSGDYYYFKWLAITIATIY